MISFNPLSYVGNLIAALPAQTSAAALEASAPAFQRPRPLSSFSSALAFSVSLALFGSVGALTGCGGRTGLLGPEDDAPAGTAEPRDAGMGGDGGVQDAGIPDAGTDAGGMDAGPVNPAYVSDLDCDGVPDLLDNCPQSANADQMDTDGDGIGDVCDNDSLNPDTDADGLLDGLELFRLGTNPTTADTDGDGVPDADDACPTTPGFSSSQGCQPVGPTCSIEAAPLPQMTLCDGTVADGFRILWSTGNAGTASLKEGSLELTTRLSGQIYVYPQDSRTYEISANTPFGDCSDSVVVTP